MTEEGLRGLVGVSLMGLVIVTIVVAAPFILYWQIKRWRRFDRAVDAFIKRYEKD